MNPNEEVFNNLISKVDNDRYLDTIINFILVLNGYRTALYFQAVNIYNKGEDARVYSIFEKESKKYTKSISFVPMNNNRFIITNIDYFTKVEAENILESEGENGIGRILGMQCYKIYPVPMECDTYAIQYFANYNNKKIEIYTEACSGPDKFSESKIKNDIKNFNKLKFLSFDYKVEVFISDKRLFIYVYENNIPKIKEYQDEIGNLIANIEMYGNEKFLKNFNFNHNSRTYNAYLAMMMIYYIFRLYKYNNKEHYDENIGFIALSLNPTKLNYEKTKNFNNQLFIDILNEKFNNITREVIDNINNFGYKKFSKLLAYNSNNLKKYSAGIKFCFITDFYGIIIPMDIISLIDDYITGYYKQSPFPLSDKQLNELLH